MKERIYTLAPVIIITLITCLLTLQLAQAEIEFTTEKINAMGPFTAEELNAFVGIWQIEDSETIIQVKSLSLKDKSEVSISDGSDNSVKQVSVSRFVGTIPLLTIETQVQGKPNAVYCLMPEGDELIGTFEDYSSGNSSDIVLKAKESLKVSVK